MNEIQELFNRIIIEQQYLANLQVNKQCLFAVLDSKRNNLNSLVERYKESFLTVEQASSRIQQLDNIKRRLSDLQAVPMQNMHQKIERLKSEATPSYYMVKIDTEAPEISRDEMLYIFRVIGDGLTWEDKDKAIHNLQQKLDECLNTRRNTITDFADELMTKDRIIHNTKQEIEDMKQRFQPPDCHVAVPLLYPEHTPSIQPEECHDTARLQEELEHSKQMIEELENETKTRQRDVDRLKQDLLSLREELKKTKADQERNHGRNASVNNNFFGQTNVMNGSSDNTQIGNQNMMRILARHVQQSPWESGN